MLAMVRRQALLFSHLLEDDGTELAASRSAADTSIEAINLGKDEHLAFRTAQLAPEQLAEIKIMFKRYDQDESGVVDFDEFSGLVSELGGGGSNTHDWYETVVFWALLHSDLIACCCCCDIQA